QACKALRQEGYEVVLVNSNPATIMTDPEMADRTYIEPLTVESVSAIIRRERPDALLPSVKRSGLPRIACCSSRRWTKPACRCHAAGSPSHGQTPKGSWNKPAIPRS